MVTLDSDDEAVYRQAFVLAAAASRFLRSACGSRVLEWLGSDCDEAAALVAASARMDELRSVRVQNARGEIGVDQTVPAAG